MTSIRVCLVDSYSMSDATLNVVLLCGVVLDNTTSVFRVTVTGN